MKEVTLYTDGACRGNPGPGGYGCVLLYKDSLGKIYRRELSKGYSNTTNNQMEIMAVIAGLEALRGKCHVKVYSDSSYVVNAFKQNWIDSWQKNGWKTSNKKPVKNKDLWLRLLDLLEKHEVSFVWVKGHANIQENERCDELATTAADSLDN